MVASLSPARVTDIKVNKKSMKAIVYVEEDQLSLAIGKEGQNARLAAKLTGWKIDIKQLKNGKAIDVNIPDTKEGVKSDLEDRGLSKRVIIALKKAGINSFDELSEKNEAELKNIKGLGEKAMQEIQTVLK